MIISNALYRMILNMYILTIISLLFTSCHCRLIKNNENKYESKLLSIEQDITLFDSTYYFEIDWYEFNDIEDIDYIMGSI